MCFPDKKLIPDRTTSGSNISPIAENPHYQRRNHKIVLYVCFLYILITSQKSRNRNLLFKLALYTDKTDMQIAIRNQYK
jgi:hypothetical protein